MKFLNSTFRFSKGVDGKGEPQDHVRGGQMTMTLNQTLPESLYSWAMRSITKDGKVDFRIKVVVHL